MDNENTKEALGSLAFQEFYIFDILRDIIRGWWLIILTALAAYMVTYVVVDKTYEPLYTSSTTFVVTTRGSSGTIYSNLTTATTTAKIFTKILDTDVLKDMVAETTGDSVYTADISASVIPETNLLGLKVVAPSPRIAYETIIAVMDSYPKVSDYMVGNAVLEVLGAPEVPILPSNFSGAKEYAQKALKIAAIAMIALLVLLSYMKDTIKDSSQVEKKLDTKLFGIVYHEAKNKTLRGRFKKNRSSILITSPSVSFSFVESYKKIRSRLNHRAKEGKLQVLLISSVLENEGKSTVAANIALALAKGGKKVLLIDGDLRKPSLHKIFQKDTSHIKGISDYLYGRCEIEALLSSGEIENLTFILESKSCKNSTELVGSKRMKILIDEMRKLFDYIIIDSPPMSLMADSEVMISCADASLLVIRESTAFAPEINDAVDVLKGGENKLLGCIYNNVKGAFSFSEGYGYGYGYGKKYGYGSYYGKKQSSVELENTNN